MSEIISYNGVNTYLNNTYGDGSKLLLNSSADRIYMNSNMGNFAYNEANLKYINSTKLDYRYVTNMSNAFYNCHNLIGSPVCGPNVTRMISTYENCNNLTGNPICGPNVTDMGWTYIRCYNLTGSPVCGLNVTNMSHTYYDCYNLTGSPVCGLNVTIMSNAYRNCTNLTGSPVCGNNVMSMANTYFNCHNLIGRPVCGPNVTNMVYTYYDCPNLYGNMYCNYTGSKLSSAVNMYMCFAGRNNKKRLNIHVKNGYAYHNWLFNVGTLISGSKLSWTKSTNKFYNSVANIHVYYNH